MPLPLPRLVFGSLYDRWNAFAPLPLPLPELRTLVAQQVAVARLDIRSVVVPTKNAIPQVAVVGVCRYQLTSGDRTLAAALATLARFARFTGVGAAVRAASAWVRLRNP